MTCIACPEYSWSLFCGCSQLLIVSPQSRRVRCLCHGARCTLIVLAERKEVGGAATYDNNLGVALVTACNRRNPPQCLDSAIHHNNLLNNILVS